MKKLLLLCLTLLVTLSLTACSKEDKSPLTLCLQSNECTTLAISDLNNEESTLTKRLKDELDADFAIHNIRYDYFSTDDIDFIKFSYETSSSLDLNSDKLFSSFVDIITTEVDKLYGNLDIRLGFEIDFGNGSIRIGSLTETHNYNIKINSNTSESDTVLVTDNIWLIEDFLNLNEVYVNIDLSSDNIITGERVHIFITKADRTTNISVDHLLLTDLTATKNLLETNLTDFQIIE